MYTVKQMPEFTGWLSGIKDAPARIRLGMRLDKAQRGWLGGGDKSSQPSDIDSAIALSNTFLKEPEDEPKN